MGSKMKRTLILILLLTVGLTVSAIAQQPGKAGPALVKAPTDATEKALPAAADQKIAQVDQKLADLQRDTQTYQLLRENLILNAALEMGLTKKDLDSMELVRVEGRWLFRKAQAPTAQPSLPAPGPSKPDPKPQL
jgi:conjugal transfer/entry exclusion protein